MSRCSNCQNELDASNKFCKKCGTKNKNFVGSTGSGVEEFITGEVKAYDERTKETSLGTHYTINYDVKVSSPDDLVGEIHVLMEGYDKTGTLKDGNTIQFDKSKSEFSGRKFKTNAVQNIDTLQWFQLTTKVDDDKPPPTKKPSKAWYLLPIFFSLIGGLIMFFVLRNQDKSMAKKGLIIGVVLFIIGIIIGAASSRL